MKINYIKSGMASIGRAYEVRRVRRAVAEKINIKGIITNCSKYIHAARDIMAHLTRCAQAHPAVVHWKPTLS